MKKLLGVLSFYLPQAPQRYVYMLQQVEYDPRLFVQWAGRLSNLYSVMRRQKLVYTKKAKALLLVSYAGWLIALLAGLYFAVFISLAAGLLLLVILVPLLPIMFLSFICLLGKLALPIVRKKELGPAKVKLSSMTAIKIAVLGSFGKTTTKEILQTVLGEAKRTASTPGNENVLISQARWINSKLKGNEEILIFEYGEYKPGDINAMAGLSQPDYAVITGLAPNHLENFGTLEALANELADIKNFVKIGNVFYPKNENELASRLKGANTYSSEEVLGWKITKSETDLSGTSFEMTKAQQKLKLKSGLVGLHQVPSLALAAAMSDLFGMSTKAIEKGISKTVPFEHRMQPYRLAGAWIVDDTYNGSLGGIKAGLELLKKLEAQRKIYVTPGLVEQGELKQSVHKQIAKLIYDTNPDIVVLMDNSATAIIQAELSSLGYKGKVEVKSDPLGFYQNLEQFVAAGDVVMMQNDWTDNYN